MNVVSTACALIALTASTGFAQSLVGTWTCERNTADAEAVSNVTFDDNGQLKALVNIDFLGHDQKVFAQARYKSSYVFEDGKLSDTPISAAINAFTIDGADAKKSDHANRLQDSLLEDNATSAKVLFTSDAYMILSPGKGAINCVRMP
ncbi:hypothetical protein [Shimia sp.]|uniref:hypothetical protein n=1 Tax=Shimia sp. TaxID=1954381 RepID=UPI003B8D1E1B